MKRERIKLQINLHKPNNNSNFVGEIQIHNENLYNNAAGARECRYMLH